LRSHGLENENHQVKVEIIPKSQSEEYHKDILNMIILDLQPISIVKDIGFRMHFQRIEPNYTIPCEKTMKKLILLEYELVKKR